MDEMSITDKEKLQIFSDDLEDSMQFLEGEVDHFRDMLNRINDEARKFYAENGEDKEISKFCNSIFELCK